MLELTHNFDVAKFKWLWAKYVAGFDERHHCTNSVRGHYSRKFSKHNPLLTPGNLIDFDERPADTFDAIYICGVSNNGYRAKLNYQHNVHAAILPEAGNSDEWTFESWRMTIRGGRFLPIPSMESLPGRYLRLGDEFTTCRIFRWAACFYRDQTKSARPRDVESAP
jgi:hypothetical protein